MSIKETELTILERNLAKSRIHEQRSVLLLKLAFVLTFLMYLLFNQHLYLGDALSWSAYFKDAASIMGFAFTVLIVLLMALFLAWVKHHAYLHFGFFSSTALIVTTVIGFALFAEFFSSSANQDAKANVLLERNSAYQSALSHDTSTSAPNTGLVSAIAQAEQTLARCEEKLKAGKEKHCNGDRAKVAALRNSEQSAHKAQAEVSIERDKLKYERQDQLKAESYNPVIVAVARLLAGKTADYKDYLKIAVVLVMLFVAVCFEILHHFLSQSHGVAVRASEGLELSIAKHSAQPELFNVSPFKQTPEKQPIGFTLPNTTPMTAHTELKPVLFKYQTEAQPVEHRAKSPIGFTFPPAGTATAKQSVPSTLPNFGQFRARRDVFASPELSDSETVLKPLAKGQKSALELEASKTLSQPLAKGSDGLYGEWVKAVNAKQCKPSVEPTWTWIQKRISNKETGSRTHDRTRISNMQKAFFARAMKEGLMVTNPNYINGGKKYLWIA